MQQTPETGPPDGPFQDGVFDARFALRMAYLSVVIQIVVVVVLISLSVAIQSEVDQQRRTYDLVGEEVSIWRQIEGQIGTDLSRLSDDEAILGLIARMQANIAAEMAHRDQIQAELAAALQPDLTGRFLVWLGVFPPLPKPGEVAIDPAIVSNIRKLTELPPAFAQFELTDWNGLSQLSFRSGQYLQPLQDFVARGPLIARRSNQVVMAAFAASGVMIILATILTRVLLTLPTLRALQEQHQQAISLARQLSEKDRTLYEAFSAIDAPACLLDASGRIISANAAFGRFAAAAGVAKPDTLAELAMQLRDGHGWAQGEVLLTGDQISQAVDQFSMVELDDRIFQMRCERVGDANHLFLATDETEEYRRRVRNLQRSKLEAIGRFASGASHDVNNILGTIMASAELMSLKLDEDDARQRDLNTIIMACRRGADLLSSVVSYSRPQQPELVLCSANALASHIERQLQPANASTVLSIDVLQPVYAEIDIRIVVTAVENLVKNAVESMRDLPERRVQIDLMPDPAGDFLIRVRDFGPGFSAESLLKALDPYYSTKGPSVGAGLGLAMVSQAVDLHRGTIRISNWARGGQVELTFAGRPMPAHVAEPDRREAEPLAEDVRQVAECGRIGASCFFLDDEAGIRTSLSDMIAIHFDQVIATGSIAEAEATLEMGHSYDAALIDWWIAETTSASIARRIRASNPDCRMVMMTGTVTEEIQDIAAELAMSVLQKPASMSKIATALGANPEDGL